MKIKIKLVDPTLPLPEYKTKGSVAFDLYARQQTTIPPKQIIMIPTNVIIQVPEGYMLMLASRSSTPKRKGLMCANSVGIIDQDFCGNEDENQYLAYNYTEETVTVEKGERIAQAVIVKIEKANFEITENMQSDSRGGIGSTGIN